jgi:hypothetical protein
MTRRQPQPSARREEGAEDEVGVHHEGAPAGRGVLVAEDREVQMRPADDVAGRSDVAEALPLHDVVPRFEAFLVLREVCVKKRVTAGRVPKVHDLPAPLVAAQALDDAVRDGEDRRPARRGQVDRVVLLPAAALGEERVAELRAVEGLERDREVRREEPGDLFLGKRGGPAVRLPDDEARDGLDEVSPERELRGRELLGGRGNRLGIRRSGLLVGVFLVLGASGRRIDGPPQPREVRRVGRGVARAAVGVPRGAWRPFRDLGLRAAQSRDENRRLGGRRRRLSGRAQRTGEGGREKEAQLTLSR